MSPKSPHIHCLTGRHLKDPELDCIFLKHYNLTAKLCSQSLTSREISIFVLLYTIVNLNSFYKEQVIEACTVELHVSSTDFCVLSIYTSPTRNFVYF